MIQNERIAYLVNRAREGNATPEELQELLKMLKEDEKAELVQHIDDLILPHITQSETTGNEVYDWNAIADEVLQSDKSRIFKIPNGFSGRRWVVAASILLILSVGGYLLIKNKKNTALPAMVDNSVKIQPGRDGAILTLADGTHISLDTIQNGVVALQGGATAKVMNGTLTYEGTGSEVVYNTMTTPRGRQFHITLPDETEVWLNSASSIRFPTVFAGSERKVTITGEAYFEVAKKPARPFRVDVNGKAVIEVLGTHFNINAYDNEGKIASTLLEGSIKVFKGNEHRVIQPGEQAQVTGHIQVINNVDMEKIIAWKNGLFNFRNASLEEIMRQLERWYDIEVVYEKGVPDIDLMGKITKGVPLNGLLKNLGELGLHYRLEGRRLIVLPSTKD